MQGRPIFLTGFMGVGKSKIGKLLACNLKREFLDTDQMVEERAGRSISEIFASEGETRFRQIEHECVVEAASRKEAVIALGGGAITQKQNWELIRSSGVLVCIEADVETILKRVDRREDRPLLAGLRHAEKRAKIEQMLVDRAPFYDRAAIRIQSSDELSPDETVGLLIQELEKWFAKCRNSA